MPLIILERDEGAFVKVTTYPQPEHPQIIVKKHSTIIASLDCTNWVDMNHIINVLNDFHKHNTGGELLPINSLRKIELTDDKQ